MSARMEEIHVSPGTLGAALVSGAVALVGWIIKTAAREAVIGLKRSIDDLTSELKTMRKEITDLNVRMVRVETWHDHDTKR
jgi:hypothetical protein